MRLRVRHETSYHYDAPVMAMTQLLRLAPRPHDGQRVLSWQVRVMPGRPLPSFIDGFGNIVHCHAINHPHRAVTILVAGEVETEATDGVVRGAAEPLPPPFFLRETRLTAAEPAIVDFARGIGGGNSVLTVLHALMRAVGERVAYRPGVTDTATTATEALARGGGVCQDHAHLFVAAARARGIPARYVGGYLWTGMAPEHDQASHAWAEAFVPDIGWVGFDPSNGVCPTEAYIRTSVGLDYLAAAPTRGIRRGDAVETLAVAVAVTAGDQ